MQTQDANYQFANNDCGTMLFHTSASAHAWTIPTNATDPFGGPGSAIVVRNTGSGAVTLTRAGGVTLRIAGSTTDQNVTLSQWGLATLFKEGTNTWVVSGSGIS